MEARSATTVCNCGGYHVACRMRDLDDPGAAPAPPPPVLRSGKAFARIASDASTAIFESDRMTCEAASGAATDCWEVPAIAEPARGVARKGVGSRFILGDGDCTCGGYHVSCRPCSPGLSDSSAASWQGDLERVSVVPPDDISSDVVLGADVCTCGGYHLACRPGSQTASMATSALFSESGSDVDEQMPAGTSSQILVGDEATMCSGISSDIVLGGNACTCGGYHLACRLASTKISTTNSDLVDLEPAVEDPLQVRVDSKTVPGGTACACGGHHLLCRLGDSERTRVSRILLESEMSEPVQEGISSQAILGDITCKCGGYHPACRLDIPALSDATVSLPPVAPNLEETMRSGISSEAVLGDTACTCGGYHLSCRL